MYFTARIHSDHPSGLPGKSGNLTLVGEMLGNIGKVSEFVVCLWYATAVKLTWMTWTANAATVFTQEYT